MSRLEEGLDRGFWIECRGGEFWILDLFSYFPISPILPISPVRPLP